MKSDELYYFTSAEVILELFVKLKNIPKPGLRCIHSTQIQDTTVRYEITSNDTMVANATHMCVKLTNCFFAAANFFL